MASPVHFATRDVGPVADKPALFQTLGPHAQAAAVEVQDTDSGGTAVDEREQVSGQRILVHDVLGQRVESIERQSHVDRLPVKEDAYPAFREEHQCLVTVRIMPQPRSILMSIPTIGVRTNAGGRTKDVTPGVFAMVPRSMNAAGCVGLAACPLAAASFDRQIWKLAVDTDSSRQKAAMVFPLCACRSKRLRQSVSFEDCDFSFSMSCSVSLNSDRIVPA